jgi:hypothetical protein
MDPIFENKLITTKDAGEIFGYSSDYLARLARSEKIIGKRIGHSWFIDKESLALFLKQQGIHKVDYARTLASEREIEYRKHRSVIHNVEKVLSKPISLPALHIKEHAFISQFVALSVSFFVVAFGAYIAYAAPFTQFITEADTIARDTAFGFNESFGNIPLRIASRITEAEIEMNTVAPRVALMNNFVSGTMASPVLVEPDLSSLQMNISDEHTYVAAYSESKSSASLTPSLQSSRMTVSSAYSFITHPVQIADSFIQTYLTVGENIYSALNTSLVSYHELIETSGAQSLALAATSRDTLKMAPEFITQMNLAFGNAIINTTHSAIRADIVFAYKTAEVAPESSRAVVALVSGIGDSIARATTRVPVLATGLFLRTTEAPALLAPALAQSVFDVEYDGASHFVALTTAGTEQYAFAIRSLGEAGYEGTSNARSLARATGSFISQDTYLGVLGKTAAAWEGLISSNNVFAAVAPTLSSGEQLALATYDTINALFSSATRSLAFLFSPPPSVVTPVVIQKIAVSTSTPSVTYATTNSYSYPSYTTIVQGVSQDFLNQSLASLSFKMITSAENMSSNVSHSILAKFDKGMVIKNGTSIEATTGTFTNLTGGTTNLGDTTITGSLTMNGALSSGTSATAPYFVATSSTATSTFAGSLAVGTSTPFGNGLFIVGTSTPLIYISGTTGRIGIGTSSPASIFDIYGTDALHLPVGTNAERPIMALAGQVRYNTETHQFEGYGDNSVWQGLGGVINPAQTTYITAGTDDFLRFVTAGAEHMTITNTGLLGIGTTSPFASLSIAGTAGGNTNLFALSTSTALFSTSTALTVNSNGDLSLLNGANLSVNGNLSITGTANFTGATTLSLAKGYFFVGDDLGISQATSTIFISSTGNLGINTILPSYKLDVVGLGHFTGLVDASHFIATSSIASQFPFASTTQLSAYASLVIGGTSTTTLKGDGNTSTIYGPLTVNGIPNTESILNIQRGTGSIGNTTLSFNDSNADPMFQIYTDANTGFDRIVSYQTALTLGTSLGGTALSIDTLHNVNATANIVPTANETYNLGSPAEYWNNGYVRNIVANNLASASTSIAGTNTSSFSIDSSNPTVDAQDISLVFYRGAGAPSNGVLSWNSTLKQFEFNQNLHISNAPTSPASTTLALAAVAGQTGALTNWLDSSGNILSTVTSTGFLGIGTSSPFASLSIAGTAGGNTNLFAISTSTSGFSTSTALTINSNGDLALLNGANLSVNGNLSVTGTATFAKAPILSSLATAAGSFLAVDGNGLVIATTTPASATGSLGQVAYFSGTNTAIGTSTLFILPRGNIGIGTTTPNWNLQIAGTRPSLALSDTSAGADQKHWLFSSMGGNLYIGTSTDAYATSTPSALTILNNGNVGIGTSSPTTYKFSVNGSASLGSGNEAMRVGSTGNIGIGTTSPYAKLSIVDNTASLRDVFAISSTTSGLIFKVDSYGRTFADGAYTATGADYAEYFYTDSVDLQSGEIVCVDIVKNSAVKRCARGADNNVMGIVSTKPSVIGNATKAVEADPSHYAVIGMMGQVEAFVSAENGAINIGDSLTSASTTPGYAMRADNGDSTVAVALESFAGTNTGTSTSLSTGKIKVLISRRNKSLAVEQVESVVVERIANMKIEDSVQQMVKEAIDTIALEKLTISGNVSAGAYETAIATSTAFSFNPTVSTSSPQATIAEIPSAVLTADGKGVDIYKLATYTLSGVQALIAKINAQEIHLASLDDRITALENGTVSSDSSTFSTTSLASALKGFGVLIQKGFAQFGTLVADQFVAATNSAGSSSAGTVTILSGNTVAQVTNAYVKPSSKIFVTLTASTTGSWYISDKQNGSFKLMLENAQPADVTFDYFIVQTEGQQATSTPEAIINNEPVITSNPPPTSESDGTSPASTASDTQGSTLDQNSQGQTLNTDTTPPVVTLVGDAAMQITVGPSADGFTDPGATASDDVDGSLTPVVTGSVDTATAGLYTLTYTATDAAGNVGSVSRVVTVVAASVEPAPSIEEPIVEPIADTPPTV